MHSPLIGRRLCGAASAALLVMLAMGSLNAGPPALSDFLIMGHTGHGCYGQSSCYDNPLLIRADENGNIVWQVTPPVLFWYEPGYILCADRDAAEDAFYLSTVFDESRVGGLHRILKYSKSGILEWDRPLLPVRSHINANPVLGGLYAASGNQLFRISATGDVLWSLTFPNAVGWATTDVTTGGVHIVGGPQAGAVSKFNAAGVLQWTKSLAPHIAYQTLSNPLDGGVYVGCDDYTHYTARLDGNGNVLWWITDFPVPWPSGGTAYGRTVDPLTGDLYIGGWPNQYGRLAANGTARWTVATPTYNPYAGARLDGNGVYISGTFYAGGIEKRNGSGALQWQKPIGPPSWSGGFYDTPAVYVGAPSAAGGCALDVTPPTLELPAVITANATTPSGATISDAALGASATDSCSAVTLTHSPPGNLFPIGSTAVTYTAADASNNQATATQTVTIVGGAGQLSELLAAVNAAPIDNQIKNSLSAKLANATSSIGKSGPAACNQLGAVLNEISAQSGKKIPAALAAQWTAAVMQIRAVLGCS